MELDFANWMLQLGESFRQRKINQIIIPGSHNAGVYNICADKNLSLYSLDFKQIDTFTFGLFNFTGWIAKWGRCHQLDIARQLKSGIRYLDLKITYYLMDGRYYIHTGENGFLSYCSILLSEALTHVAAFCYAHPGEIILVEVTFDDSIPNIEDVLTKFTDAWRCLLHPNKYNGTLYANINEMCTLGQKIVLFSNCITPKYRTQVWPAYIIRNSWLQTNDPQLRSEDMERLLLDAVPTENNLNHLTWTLKPDRKDILGSLFKNCIAYRSYEEMATSFNRNFEAFLEKNRNLVIQKASIISFDWFDGGEQIYTRDRIILEGELIISRIIELNNWLV